MPRPRRPDRTTIDPEMLERGEVGELTAVYDEYFVPDGPGALEVILDIAVGKLPEPDRSCVTMVAMHGMTYDETAEHLAAELGRRVHRKTIWRWVQRGLDQIRSDLAGQSWSAILLADRIPTSGAVPPEDPHRLSDRDIEALEGDAHADHQPDV